MDWLVIGCLALLHGVVCLFTAFVFVCFGGIPYNVGVLTDSGMQVLVRGERFMSLFWHIYYFDVLWCGSLLVLCQSQAFDVCVSGCSWGQTWGYLRVTIAWFGYPLSSHQLLSSAPAGEGISQQHPALSQPISRLVCLPTIPQNWSPRLTNTRRLCLEMWRNIEEERRGKLLFFLVSFVHFYSSLSLSVVAM